MKLIEAAHLHFYRSEAHYEFGGYFRNLVNRFPAVGTVVVKYLPDYDALYAKEGELVDRMIKSNFTDKIAETDRLIDRYVTGIRETVLAATRHFDHNVAEAATAILNRLKAFGRVESKSYEEESAAVKLLVTELQNTEYAPMSDLVGITEWLRRLEEAENEFEQLFNLRNTELADRTEGTLREVRREIDKIYHAMVDRIDATATLDETNAYTEFIKQLNAYITYLNEHTHQHAKKDVKNAVVASIPDQPYAGEPVIVLPEVMYEGKKLVFTTDYEVSYKNNNAPGTATLTVHGKGAYKGQKAVSFNIVNG
ncbi:MAG: DUF6261 family protein [Prevotellaceae bacterium]|jgi:hypothetical protein|nr:DUF6261 family protein [Prevotellaceae bacterium]